MAQQEHDGEGPAPGADADGPIRLTGVDLVRVLGVIAILAGHVWYTSEHRAPDHVLVARSRLLHAERLPLGRGTVAARGVLATLAVDHRAVHPLVVRRGRDLPDLGVCQGLRTSWARCTTSSWPRGVAPSRSDPSRRSGSSPPSSSPFSSCDSSRVARLSGRGPAHWLRSSCATPSRSSLFAHRWPWCRASPAPCSSSSASSCNEYAHASSARDGPVPRSRWPVPP